MMGWLASQADMLAINRNMRCIEIIIDRPFEEVLKEINRNMRCIEIVFNPSLSELATVINRNMRCIEMIIKVP